MLESVVRFGENSLLPLPPNGKRNCLKCDKKCLYTYFGSVANFFDNLLTYFVFRDVP
jgi:hypothetical protein